MKKLLSLALVLCSFALAQNTVKIPIYSVPGIVDAATMVAAVEASIDASVNKQNSAAADVVSNGCKSWTEANLHNRDLNLALIAKPIQPPVVHASYSVVGSGSAVILLVTETTGPDLIGSSCPDLPAPIPVAPPAGTVQIGMHIFGAYWAQGPVDNPPDDVFNGKQFAGKSVDGVSGTWMFVPSPMTGGSGRKGWYLKVQ